MGIKGIENLTGNTCEEWWKATEDESQGSTHPNHICVQPLNHLPPCVCECLAVRPLEDHD